MTEEEWLTSGDWVKLWRHADDVGLRTERKTRLFAAAACRRFAHRLVDPRCLQAVEVCEALADGQAGEADREAARDGAKFESGPPIPGQCTAIGRAASVATHWICYSEYKVGRTTEAAPSVHGYEAAVAAGLLTEHASPAQADEVTKLSVFREGVARGERIQADLLREVIGNPFHPVGFELAWRAQTVLALAQVAYEERSLPSGELDSTRLAILADALEDAGCTDAEILGHLRTATLHVRGCWAVDLLLGKE